ncbi:MAG: SDR family oxidoreductase [Anaerolineae bacterium]|nr:SDR family oxidoreductase [Thermoflexales bacterium]MDW8406224.1 SDR family oxidoreductase [Anaerolineae bacterium]
MNVFRLDDQLALITGGGTGLGLAMARAMREAGARVILTGRRREPLEQACAELGAGAAFIQHDIDDLDSIPSLIEQAEAQHGPLDIVVSNAGNHLKKPALDTSDEEFARIVHTHVFGGFALCREAGRRMARRGRGSLLLITSMTALFGVPQVAAYGAAKAALVGLMRVLAVELSPQGVRVNAIAPGWIETALSLKALEGDPGRRARILQRTPMGRLGDTMDVGYAAVYLCSPAARYVNNIILPVDGGMSNGF